MEHRKDQITTYICDWLSVEIDFKVIIVVPAQQKNCVYKLWGVWVMKENIVLNIFFVLWIIRCLSTN